MSLYGFWISPSGEVIDVTNSTHINLICNNCDKFGFSKDELEKIFSEYKEAWSTEKKAREVIIKKAVLNGWVRIRKYYKPDRVTFNIDSITNQNTINLIFNFAKQGLQGEMGQNFNRHDEVNISQFKEEVQIDSINFEKLSNGDFGVLKVQEIQLTYFTHESFTAINNCY